MEFSASEFKSKFAFSMYKELKLRMGEMTFTKDFVTDTRGDLYPLLFKSDDLAESVERNLYTVEKGTVKRLFPLCKLRADRLPLKRQGRIWLPSAGYRGAYHPLKGQRDIYLRGTP